MKMVRSSNANRQTRLCFGICVIGALLIFPVQKSMEARLGDPGPDPDLLYFNSPSVVKKIALGYSRILADLYWIRTIQYYGRRDEAAKRTIRYKNLPALLDITTTLDPDFIDAYRTGYFFLAEHEPVGAGKPKEALKLLDKGLEIHPNDWRLLYDKGMNYYVYLQDYKAAGNVWLEASRIQGAPKHLEPLAAKSLSEGGAMDTARYLWQRQYEDSTREDIRENARNRLISIQVAEDLWTLEFLIQLYQLENGMYPQSLEALQSEISGKIRIRDPLGTPYRYDPETVSIGLGPGSKVLYTEVPESYKEDFLAKFAGNLNAD